MLVIKGATTQTFFFNAEVSQTLQRICFKVQNFSVKPFPYAKFAYRTVSNFSNTKFEKLPKAKLLKLEVSTFGDSSFYCVNIKTQFISK